VKGRIDHYVWVYLLLYAGCGNLGNFPSSLYAAQKVGLWQDLTMLSVSTFINNVAFAVFLNDFTLFLQPL